MHPSRDPAGEARLHAVALVAVLLLAFALRVWGLGFGVPLVNARPDEIEVVGRAVRFLSGDLNPHFFHYPSLFFYLVGALVAAWTGVAVLIGGGVAEVLAEAAVDPSRFLLMARWLSVIAGVATVAAVYGLGRRFSGRGIGLLAAALLAVAPLHTRDSHFATTDVTLALFLVLAVWALLGVLERGRTLDYALAGLFAGLAVSTKYVGLVLIGALVVTHSVHHLPDLRARGWARATRAALNAPGPWIFFGSGVAAFTLTSPYAWLDWGLFTTHFRFQLGHLSGGHGVDLGVGGVYHLRHTLPKGLGLPVFLAAMYGVALAIRRDPARSVVLLAFPVLFFASTANSRTLFLRYMIPLLPFACVLAALAVSELPRRLPGPAALVWGILLVVFAGPPAVRSVQIDRALSRTDSRVLAAEWLLAEVGPEPVTVHQTGTHWAHLELPPTVDSLAYVASLVAGAANTPSASRTRAYARLQARARLDARRGSAAELGGFRAVHFDSATGFGRGEPPEWIVTFESPLVQYTALAPGLESILRSRYREVQRVDGVPLGGSGWYDQHDAFFVPFVGFRGVARPGPAVTIFRRLPRAEEAGPGPPSSQGNDR